MPSDLACPPSHTRVTTVEFSRDEAMLAPEAIRPLLGQLKPVNKDGTWPLTYNVAWINAAFVNRTLQTGAKGGALAALRAPTPISQQAARRAMMLIESQGTVRYRVTDPHPTCDPTLGADIIIACNARAPGAAGWHTYTGGQSVVTAQCAGLSEHRQITTYVHELLHVLGMVHGYSAAGFGYVYDPVASCEMGAMAGRALCEGVYLGLADQQFLRYVFAEGSVETHNSHGDTNLARPTVPWQQLQGFGTPILSARGAKYASYVTPHIAMVDGYRWLHFEGAVWAHTIVLGAQGGYVAASDSMLGSPRGDVFALTSVRQGYAPCTIWPGGAPAGEHDVVRVDPDSSVTIFVASEAEKRALRLVPDFSLANPPVLEWDADNQRSIVTFHYDGRSSSQVSVLPTSATVAVGPLDARQVMHAPLRHASCTAAARTQLSLDECLVAMGARPDFILDDPILVGIFWTGLCLVGFFVLQGIVTGVRFWRRTGEKSKWE